MNSAVRLRWLRPAEVHCAAVHCAADDFTHDRFSAFANIIMLPELQHGPTCGRKTLGSVYVPCPVTSNLL